MADTPIRFDDGAAYEQMMGVWSRSAGEIFLDWVAPASGLRWVDVGCGNGAFTALIVGRCAPSVIHGIDPSEGQLAFARTRPDARGAEFHQGDAMVLPFADAGFDMAVMGLVIFFVPKPATGVAEMVRVVRPGGIVATYAWDMLDGGFPLEPIYVEMRALGHMPVLPPSAAASRIDALRELWTGAHLEAVETREITVQRIFVDFDAFWTTSLKGPASAAFAKIPPADVEKIKARVRAGMTTDSSGRITATARANAVKGRVPT